MFALFIVKDFSEETRCDPVCPNRGGCVGKEGPCKGYCYCYGVSETKVKPEKIIGLVLTRFDGGSLAFKSSSIKP